MKSYLVNKMNDLPLTERPRERLITKGASSLSIIELLEIIISRGTQTNSVVNIAYQVISKYKNKNFSNVTFNDLIEIKGIGQAKACQLVATFEFAKRINDIKYKSTKSKVQYSPDNVIKSLRVLLTDENKEHLTVISLDSRKNIISIDLASIGTINETIAHPREVFKIAIDNLATYIVIAHNHPSEDLEPSSEDLVLTRRLLDVSYTIGIPLIDHLIVSKDKYVSLKEANLID